MHSDADSIVVGVDGSTSACSALRWAAGEARLRGVALVAVYAWTPIRSDQGVRRMAHNAWEHLDRILSDAHDDTVGVAVHRVVERGDPTSVLLAEAVKGSLLVIGATRPTERSALRRSVAWHCMHCATCPVVVVPDRSTTRPSTEPRPRTELADMRLDGVSGNGRRIGARSCDVTDRLASRAHAAADASGDVR